MFCDPFFLFFFPNRGGEDPIWKIPNIFIFWFLTPSLIHTSASYVIYQIICKTWEKLQIICKHNFSKTMWHCLFYSISPNLPACGLWLSGFRKKANLQTETELGNYTMMRYEVALLAIIYIMVSTCYFHKFMIVEWQKCCFCHSTIINFWKYVQITYPYTGEGTIRCKLFI